jgi:hypothetical protein
LVEAAQVTGLYHGRFFYGDGKSEHWTPIEVVVVERRGSNNDIEAIYLEATDREAIKFRFQSDHAVIEHGDVVMKRNNQVSIFSVEDMVDLLFQIDLIE